MTTGAILLACNLDLTDATARPSEGLPVVLPNWAPRDVHVAGGVGLLHPAKLGLGRGGTTTARLKGPDEAQRLNGIIVVGNARAAVEDDPSELPLLVACFRRAVLRVPEVHRYLGSLPVDQALKIIGDRRGRGRPRELGLELSRVYTLDALRRKRHISIARAATELGKLEHVSAERLRNSHSELSAYAQIRAQGLFVAGDRIALAPYEWGQPPLANLSLHVFPQLTPPPAKEPHR